MSQASSSRVASRVAILGSIVALVMVLVVGNLVDTWLGQVTLVWQAPFSAGLDAYNRGRLAEAEKHWLAALERVEDLPFWEDKEEKRLMIQSHLARLHGAGEDADRHYKQGRTYAAKELYKEAIASFERAVELNPGHASALNDLAWYMATSDDPTIRNPRKALQHAKKAVALTPEPVPGHLDTLAEAYYATRQLDRAIVTERKAISLDPENDFLKQQLEKFQEAKAHQVNR